ncbi:hypothetical protein D3C77_386240 [compost metagenome]
MAPVLENFALAGAPPGELVEHGLWITAQAGKQRQVMGTHQGIDRVDLHHPQALDHPRQVSDPDVRAWRTGSETLGRQRQTTRL